MSSKIALNLDNVVDTVVNKNVAVTEAKQAVDDSKQYRDESSDILTTVATKESNVENMHADVIGFKEATESYMYDTLNAKTSVDATKLSIEEDVVYVTESRASVEASEAKTLNYRTFTKNAVADFNKRFLGMHDTDPTVTYNGEEIKEGAVYWNTEFNRWLVYTGNIWVNASTADGALLVANNLADLDDYQEARDTLEIETSAQLNDRDTANRDRDNHTGTQPLDTITETDDLKVFTSDERDKLNIAITTNDLLDEDDMSSNDDTKLATQQSIKAYVDGKIIDEDDMGSDSDVNVPTQQSVKAYVDSSIKNTLASEMTYKGSYDADANTPNLDEDDHVEINVGDMYTVTVDGDIYGVNVSTGDVLIAEVDDASSADDWTIVNRNLQERASEITVDSNGNLTSSNVQDALVELQDDIDTINADDTVDGSIDNNIKLQVLDKLAYDGDGNLTTKDNVIITDKIEQIDSGIILGRVSADTGNIEKLDKDDVKAILLPMLSDNNDITLDTLADNHILIYDSTDSIWKNIDSYEVIRDVIGDTLVAGHNITITVDDDNDSITIAHTTNQEEVEDIVGNLISANSSNIQVNYDDDNGTLTIDTQIIDDLVSTDTDKSLSANQGKVLKGITDDLNDKKAIKAQDYDTETTYKDKEDDTLYKLYVDNGDIVLEEV